MFYVEIFHKLINWVRKGEGGEDWGGWNKNVLGGNVLKKLIKMGGVFF